MISSVPELGPAVNTVIRKCLGGPDGEDVLVMVDAATRSIGQALRDGAAQAGADAVLAIMDERGTTAPNPRGRSPRR